MQINHIPKDTISVCNLVQIGTGLETSTLGLSTQTLGWKLEEVDFLLAKLKTISGNRRCTPSLTCRLLAVLIDCYVQGNILLKFT